MWYLWVAAVTFFVGLVFIFYRFITDKEPFNDRNEGDINELLTWMSIFFMLSLVWPLSLTVLTVVQIRGFRKDRAKKGINLAK